MCEQLVKYLPVLQHEGATACATRMVPALRAGLEVGLCNLLCALRFNFCCLTSLSLSACLLLSFCCSLAISIFFAHLTKVPVCILWKITVYVSEYLPQTYPPYNLNINCFYSPAVQPAVLLGL